MSDDRVRTRICTPTGELEFQTYFVKRRARDKVLSVRFEGAAEATARSRRDRSDCRRRSHHSVPLESFYQHRADSGCSRAYAKRFERKRDRVVAISPIVGGRALKGPAAHMMKSMRLRPAAAEVARLYADFVGVFVLDEVDRKQAAAVEKLGMRPVVTNTVMRGPRETKSLARVVVRELGIDA